MEKASGLEIKKKLARYFTLGTDCGQRARYQKDEIDRLIIFARAVHSVISTIQGLHTVRCHCFLRP